MCSSSDAPPPPQYTRLSVMDGDTMVLSPSYSIVAMATPGHTPACTTFVLMRRGAAGACAGACGCVYVCVCVAPH
jgi:hypothetical protein